MWRGNQRVAGCVSHEKKDEAVSILLFSEPPRQSHPSFFPALFSVVFFFVLSSICLRSTWFEDETHSVKILLKVKTSFSLKMFFFKRPSYTKKKKEIVKNIRTTLPKRKEKKQSKDRRQRKSKKKSELKRFWVWYAKQRKNRKQCNEEDSTNTSAMIWRIAVSFCSLISLFLSLLMQHTPFLECARFLAQKDFSRLFFGSLF